MQESGRPKLGKPDQKNKWNIFFWNKTIFDGYKSGIFFWNFRKKIPKIVYTQDFDDARKYSR